jgi:hypothetical protein
MRQRSERCSRVALFVGGFIEKSVNPPTGTGNTPAPISECERNWQNRDQYAEWDHDTFSKNCEEGVKYLNTY